MRPYNVISCVISLTLCASLSAGCSGSSDSSDQSGDNGGSGRSDAGGIGNGNGGDGGSSADGGGSVANALSATASSSLIMAPGGSAALTVKIVRTGGWDGDVALTAKGLPSGITADATTIAKGSTSADVTFHATASATASAAPSSIDASGNGLSATAAFAVSIGRQSVDPSFGTGGIAFMAPDQEFDDFVAQNDGKIVATTTLDTGVGYQTAPALVRLDAAGKIDPSFGTSGHILFVQGTSQAGVALQDDGKILTSFRAPLSSAGTPRVFVTRTLTNGTLDASFGTAGYAAIDFGTCTSISGLSTIAIASDGSIIVGAPLGCTDGTTAYTQGAVARLTAGGAADATFGSAGKLILSASATSSTGIGHLVTTSDALYVLATHYYNKPGQGFVTEGTLMKYDTNASALDASFASAGVLTRPGTFSNETTTFSCLIPQTGKGLVWGIDGGGQFGRISTSGAPDATFGDGSDGVGGVALTETFDGDWDDDNFTDLALGAGNTLFLAQSNIPKRSVELWAYSADGIRDTSWGDANHRIIVATNDTPSVKRVRVGADGRIVVLAGLGSDPGEAASAFLRFFP